MDYSKELAFAKELAKEAGDIMRRYFLSNDMDTELKNDSTPITVADTTINELVINKVKEQFPECGVIGEEDSYEAERKNVWVVDPIDGTIPFTLGVPVSTFCMAYVVEGEVKASVVYDPYQDRLYWASKDGGAFLNDKKLQVSDNAGLDNAYFVCGGEKLNDFVNTLQSNPTTRVFDLFSYAFAGSLVAAGTVVGAVMTYGSPWDAAAISLIVEEAGGTATDLLGNARKYNEWGDGILITNGKQHQKLVEMINHENIRD